MLPQELGEPSLLNYLKKKCQLILSARNEESLEEVSKICNVNGSSTLVIPFDLADEKSIDLAANSVIDKKLNID